MLTLFDNRNFTEQDKTIFFIYVDVNFLITTTVGLREQRWEPLQVCQVDFTDGAQLIPSQRWKFNWC